MLRCGILLADTAKSLFDVWFVGDSLLADVFGTFAEIQEELLKRRNKEPQLYLHEYYNVKSFYELSKNGIQYRATRIVNAVVDAVNQTHRLPHFLIIMPDKDILAELDVFNYQVETILRQYVLWMVKQISMVIRRKKAELLDKKPGAIYAGDPVLIFVRMIR